MSNRLRIWSLAGLMLLIKAGPAFAELDPELAEASTAASNDAGLIAGGFLEFGTTLSAGKTRPGKAVLTGAEIGYSMPRDSWNRFIVSLAVSGGAISFKKQIGDSYDDRNIGINLMPMARFGYGKSLGHRATWVSRVGAGIFLGTAKGEYLGEQFSDAADGFSGVVGQIGADFIFSASNWVDLTVGYQLNHFSFEIDEIESISNNPIPFSAEAYNLNAHMLSLGLALHF
jgi:hypothetical protein